MITYGSDSQSEISSFGVWDVLNSIPEPCVVIGRDLRIIRVNSAFAGILTGPGKDLGGEPVHSLFATQTGVIEGQLNQVLSTGLPVQHFETEIRTEQGHTARAVFRFFPIRREIDGKTSGIIGVVALEAGAAGMVDGKSGDERLEAARIAARAGVWEWQFRTNMVTVSADLAPPLHLHLNGNLHNGAVFLSFGDWLQTIHPEDRELVRAELDGVRAKGGKVRHDFRTGTDGEIRWFTLVADAFHEGDRLERLVGFVADITERRSAEAAAIRDARLESIGRLAGGVAHDFNNLLSGILGGASFLQELLPGDHPARNILDVIVRSSERASILTKHLLAYSGRSTTALRPLNLASAVREACSIAQGALPPNIELTWEDGVDWLPVQADVSQIRDIVMNLVVNSADAIGEEPGQVFVRTGTERLNAGSVHRRFNEPVTQAGDCAFFQIRDTGEGMTPEVMARMYEPFFTTRFTGRGLGLSAVQGFMHGHGGFIEVESAPGRGTTFRLLFPLLPGDRNVTESGRERGVQALVIVIDDEHAIRQVALAALGHAGYEVVTASNGEAGIELFRTRAAETSLVMLDVSMPGLSSKVVFQKLREIRADVPVLVTSGYPRAEVMAEFAAGGPTGFIQKPFTSRRLLADIHRLIPAKGRS